MLRLPVTLMTLHSSSPRHPRERMAISLRSQPSAPPVRTPCPLEKLPPELRYMIYSYVLTDRVERKLQHPLLQVSKQVSADFAETITRLLGPRAQLTVQITNSSISFQLGFNVPRGGETRFHDVLTGSFIGRSFHTGWNSFRTFRIGRQMLSRTMRVIIRWPFLNTTFWIMFEPGCAPAIDLESKCRLAIDARTRVSSKNAENMLMVAAEKWRADEFACSAVWTDIFIKDLRRKWQVLRWEANDARRREALREAERRRADRELVKRLEAKRNHIESVFIRQLRKL
jgi:hypothetical protein